jgi:hypothetical protein
MIRKSEAMKDGDFHIWDHGRGSTNDQALHVVSVACQDEVLLELRKGFLDGG